MASAMRRLGSVWSTKGLARETPTPWQPRRASHLSRQLQTRAPLRNPFPTDLIPDVVLDLDAEDHPHVRQYDDLDEAAEVAKWSENPQVEAIAGRLETFSREVAQADARMKDTASAFGPWRVTDRDILSVALRGGASPAGSAATDEESGPGNASIGQVLFRNGIPPRVTRDDSNTIQFMLHRQEIAERREFQSSEEFTSALENCQTLSEIRRFVSQASRTGAGCDTVSRCAVAISRQLSPFLQGPEEEHVVAVLKLVNNATLNLESRNLSIGQPLCYVGLLASSKAFQLPAVQRYLRIGLDADYFHMKDNTPVPAAAEPLTESLSAILKSLQTPPQQGKSDRPNRLARPAGTRSAVFGLLTGGSLTASARQPSVRSTMAGPESFTAARHVYLALLGELGALRTLWHECHWVSDGQPWRKVDTDALATAVVRYALDKKRDQHMPQNAAYGWTATGRYEEDVLLDLQSISSRDAVRPRSAAGTPLDLQEHATAELLAIPGAVLADGGFRAAVARAFDRDQIRDAMEDLQTLVDGPYLAARLDKNER